jgi:hypothetical protein
MMDTTLPAGLRRVKMPTDLPWSGLVAWMHRKIAEHAANSARWYHRCMALNPDREKAGYQRRQPESPEDKRRRVAKNMRAYRKRIKDRRAKLLKELDDGTLMYRVAMTKWQNRKRWLKMNRRRLLRAGKWRGFPPKPVKADFLTKAKPKAR